VTRAMKTLENIGLVTTQKNERGARQSLAVISATGQEILIDANGILQDIARQLSINKQGENKIAELNIQLVELKS